MTKKLPTNRQDLLPAFTAEINKPHDITPYVEAGTIRLHPGGWIEFMDEATSDLFGRRVVDWITSPEGVRLYKLRRWTKREQKIVEAFTTQMSEGASRE